MRIKCSRNQTILLTWMKSDTWKPRLNSSRTSITNSRIDVGYILIKISQLFFLYEHKKGISCKLQFFLVTDIALEARFEEATRPPPPPPPPPPPSLTTKSKGQGSLLRFMLYPSECMEFFYFERCTCLVYSFFLFWNNEKLFVLINQVNLNFQIFIQI